MNTAVATLITRRVITTYYVTLDDHDYRVTHTKWAASKWNDGGETWSVITSHTDRVCDPDKPTHKRVVAALKNSVSAM